MTYSEILFERFCALHGLPRMRIEECATSTPDYLVRICGLDAIIEIKQIDEDENFSSAQGSRTVGDHVRAKICASRKQVQPAARQGTPAILLIYNNLDPLQSFGTEQHDFVAAMYGEPSVTLSLETGAIVDSFEGTNKSFHFAKNTSFSAVGHLKRSEAGPLVHLYENLYAKIPLDYGRLPAAFTCTRFEASANGDA